ncbi:hypothetical protein [Micromonospora coerulea]|uniref:hypothetical protein n=1 Tax=Micromonospora coerulea TaxID=47856 RepID=UPI0031F85249
MSVGKIEAGLGSEATDALLLRLHTETACRRGGALALRLVDLDTTNGLVRLTEKGSTVRWQSITHDLVEHLIEHAHARGAVLHTDRLLNYRNGARSSTSSASSDGSSTAAKYRSP